MVEAQRELRRLDRPEQLDGTAVVALGTVEDVALLQFDARAGAGGRDVAEPDQTVQLAAALGDERDERRIELLQRERPAQVERDLPAQHERSKRQRTALAEALEARVVDRQLDLRLRELRRRGQARDSRADRAAMPP